MISHLGLQQIGVRNWRFCGAYRESGRWMYQTVGQRYGATVESARSLTASLAKLRTVEIEEIPGEIGVEAVLIPVEELNGEGKRLLSEIPAAT